MTLLTLNFLILTGLSGLCATTESETMLREDLMKSYNPSVTPGRPVLIDVGFALLNVDVDEVHHTVDLELWITMVWTDPRLTWDLNTQGTNISKLSFTYGTIWLPDIMAYNDLYSRTSPYITKTHQLVTNNGSVIWVPPVHVKARCNLDLTNWPHDSQNCSAKFGSWVHSAEAVDVKIKTDYLLTDSLVETSELPITFGEWSLIFSSVKRFESHYNCCPEAYITFDINVVLERRAPAYSWTVQLPTVVLCVLTVAMFLIPPTAGEKLLFAVVCLVLDFFFLMVVTQVINTAPSKTPLLVQLVAEQLLLTAIGLVVSCLMLRAVRNPHGKRLPRVVRRILFLLSSCLCLQGYRNMVSMSMNTLQRGTKGDDLELEDNAATPAFEPAVQDGDWLLLVAVVDRICLVVYIAVLIINMIVYCHVL